MLLRRVFLKATVFMIYKKQKPKKTILHNRFIDGLSHLADEKNADKKDDATEFVDDISKNEPKEKITESKLKHNAETKLGELLFMLMSFHLVFDIVHRHLLSYF